MFSSDALHNEASHGCDAFRTFAVVRDKLVKEIEEEGKPPPQDDYIPQSQSWMC